MTSYEGEPSAVQEELVSFAELEQKENITAEELKRELRSYAESGAAILSDVVISIIDRVKLTSQDLKELRDIAQEGIKIQEENRLSSEPATVEKEKKEYQEVVRHIDEKVAD